MYGYSQGNYGGYGSNYSSSAAAVAAASAYGSLGQAAPSAQPSLQNSVFGWESSATAPYASYGNSVAAAYGYGQQSSNAAATASAYAAQQQVSRMAFDAYTAAAAAATPAQYASFGGAKSNAYGGSQPVAGTARPLGTPASSAKSTSAKGNGGNYNGYDAAVYAAASSYLQSKAAGTTNMWMSKNNSSSGSSKQRGLPGYNQKRFGGGSNLPRESQQFYCEVCKISCAGQLTYKEHLEGQRHKKKEALAKGENSQSLPKSKVSFRCDLCNVTCTGQDTYSAHVRGTKHQKTLALCKRLGKPIPETLEPTIIAPAEMGGTMPPPPVVTGNSIPTVGQPTKRVVGISTVNFVPGAKLSMGNAQEVKKQQCINAVGSAGKADAPIESAVKAQTEEIQALIAAEQNVQPVGEDYIESQRDGTGKLIQYICKLCDCKFSDPNAKEIHLKGRRHRLQYKLKVDPNLEVDIKVRGGVKPRNVKQHVPIPNAVRAPFFATMQGPRGGLWFGGGPMEARRFDSLDDRHVQAKHTSIYPEDSRITAVEELVSSVEKSLKKVSDFFNERESSAKTEEKPTTDANKENSRLLKGVMRVGNLSKLLLLKTDTEISLVVLCSEVPTTALLKDVADNLVKLFEKSDKTPVTPSIEEKIDESAIIVTIPDCDIKCRITLTSRAFREGEIAQLPQDSLNKEACLQALAHLRHSKWFQARCAYLQGSQVTLRILRDIRSRNDEWKPLTDWMTELLVERVLSSWHTPLSIGDSLRRIFEAIAVGVLLPSGPGIQDPCEKENVDALAPLTADQRDKITASAQKFLRLMAFNQVYKILGIERLPDIRPPLMDRKRPLDDEKPVEDVKKDKKEGEEEEESTNMEC